MFSEGIEDFLRRDAAPKKGAPRVSMNVVAKQHAPGKLTWLDEERRLPASITTSVAVTGPRASVKKKKDKKPIETEYMETTTTQASGTHTESMVKVFFTKDYRRFVKVQGNRTLNKKKIKRIKDDIAAGLDLLKYCPIIVAEKDGKLEIIDGQHRFAVATELKSHVWYIVADELTLLEIAKMNSNTEKWKNRDFIHCYTSQGNEHYAKIDEFMKKYGFPMSVTVGLLTKGTILADGSSVAMMNDFQAGTVKVTRYADAVKVAETVMAFEGFAAKCSRTFVVAVCKILEAEKMPIEDVIEAYRNNKERLQAHGNWKDYLVNLETIVNIGKSKRRVIY
jgi:hypothetical protein